MKNKWATAPTAPRSPPAAGYFTGGHRSATRTLQATETPERGIRRPPTNGRVNLMNRVREVVVPKEVRPAEPR